MEVLLAAFFVIFVLLAGLWLIVPALHGLPPISSSRGRIRRALKMADLKEGETLYDLGAGHGNVLVIAAKEFGANAVGIEIGPVECLIARWNAFYNGVSSKVRIEAGNFYKADLSRADVVYAYLTTGHAIRLQKRLESQLRAGARVVTVACNIPAWQPDVFDREDLIYLFRMPPENRRDPA